MPTIFISYRRADSASAAGRLYDRLVERYGRASVFKDVDSIPPGVRFADYIVESIQSSDVALIVIGPRWLDAAAGFGRRRLDDPADFVRIEIETALKLGVPTFPVLVDGAREPTPRQLPESLRPLVERNGVTLRQDPYFGRDVEQVFAAVDYWQGPAPFVREPLDPTSAAHIAAPAAAPTTAPSDRRRPKSVASGQPRVASKPLIFAGVAFIVLALLAYIAAPTVKSLLGFGSGATSRVSRTAATPITLGYTAIAPGCDEAHWTPPRDASSMQCAASSMTLSGTGPTASAAARVSDSGDAYAVQVTVSGLQGGCAVELTGAGADLKGASYVIDLQPQGKTTYWSIFGAPDGPEAADGTYAYGSVPAAPSYTLLIQVSANQLSYLGDPIIPDDLALSVNGKIVQPYGDVSIQYGSAFKEVSITPGSLTSVQLLLFSNSAASSADSGKSATFSNFSLTRFA